MLFDHLSSGSLLERAFLADDRAVRVGAVYQMTYGEATVLTHDKWKFDAGGIPRHSFLLATAKDVAGTQPDDDEVLLLRVEDTAPLSLEADLHAVREESLRAALSRAESPSPSEVLDIEMDPFTRNRVSFTGLRCRILGTFYESERDGQRFLDFGADVDNFYATVAYRVLKPIGEGLSTIASFLKAPAGEVEPVRVGTVRYSATQRRARASGQADAPVYINMWDFIGHKTALLGMTRTGKSNTAKTIVARTFVASETLRGRGEGPIGQLIFDPQGEYANANTQDETHIAAIGARHVSIYKFGADGTQPHVKPLQINFFAENQIETVQSLIAGELAGDGASGYVQDFAGTQFTDGDQDGYSANAHAGRARLLLYASLVRAGFTPPKGYRARIAISQELRGAVTESLQRNPFHDAGTGHASVAAADLEAVVDAILDLRDDGHAKANEFTKDPRWSNVEPIFTRKSGKSTVRGWKNLNNLKPFHSPITKTDPASDIYDELLNGKIVIVDLHLGPESTIRELSASIVGTLLKKQTDAFTSGKEPPRIQVMLEEAHNLFASDRYKNDSDVWVRLAKEASKLRLGMTYATQEVTGVAHQVKANTANWVVAHLNNMQELNELAKFYDFASYKDSIISSEDRGYVRLKSLSSPYIVPVQIDRYGLDLVNEARRAAGDPPLGADASVGV